jgi:hypothetical protein
MGAWVFADGPANNQQTDPAKSTSQAKPPAKTTSKGFFPDVPADHWAAADLKFLAERGIVTGNANGEFKGASPMTRYDAGAMLARAIRYLQNDPERIKAQELKVLQDLMFQLSQKIQGVEQEVKSVASSPRGDSQKVLELQSRLESANVRIDELQRQLNAVRTSSTGIDPIELDKVRKQAQANFIIGVAGLFVGIVGIALATLL